jgi:hypothetical protein
MTAANPANGIVFLIACAARRQTPGNGRNSELENFASSGLGRRRPPALAHIAKCNLRAASLPDNPKSDMKTGLALLIHAPFFEVGREWLDERHTPWLLIV